MSVIDDLDDYCYVLATKFFSELCREIEERAGRKPTIGELCDLLTWGLRGCKDEILEDVNTANVLALRPKLARRGKITLQPGDVVAIPARSGDYYMAVFITNNRFGHAFGVLREKHKFQPVQPGSKPEVLPYPFYADSEYITSGRWRKLGNHPEFLTLFPAEPDSYHYKKDWPDNERIGPFGSAESPAGTLRHITEDEAREVGLLSGEFIQGMGAGEFEELLDRRFDTPKKYGEEKGTFIIL